MPQTFTASGETATDDQLTPPDIEDDKPTSHVDHVQADGTEVRTFESDEVVATKEAAAGTAIVATGRLDISTLGEDWQHDWLEFKGDKLGIRLPTRQALAAFSLASSKYVDIGVKNDLTGLFIARHLSAESYGRVFSRLMDPDENDYDVETVGELFNAIVTASINADKAEAAAKVPDKGK